MTEDSDEAVLAYLASLPRPELPEAWRGPAPADADEMSRRLDGLRGDVIRGVVAGQVCPIMGEAFVGRLDDIGERGVPELLDDGYDVFAQLQEIARVYQTIRPLPRIPGECEGEVPGDAFIARCREMLQVALH